MDARTRSKGLQRAVERAVHGVDGVNTLDFAIWASSDHPLYSTDPAGFIKCLDKVAVVMVNCPMLARRLRHSPDVNPFPAYCCALFFALCALFPRPALSFQQLPHSFSKAPGVAYPFEKSSAAPKRKNASL